MDAFRARHAVRLVKAVGKTQGRKGGGERPVQGTGTPRSRHDKTEAQPPKTKKTENFRIFSRAYMSLTLDDARTQQTFIEEAA